MIFFLSSFSFFFVFCCSFFLNCLKLAIRGTLRFVYSFHFGCTFFSFQYSNLKSADFFVFTSIFHYQAHPGVCKRTKRIKISLVNRRKKKQWKHDSLSIAFRIILDKRKSSKSITSIDLYIHKHIGILNELAIELDDSTHNPIIICSITSLQITLLLYYSLFFAVVCNVNLIKIRRQTFIKNVFIQTAIPHHVRCDHHTSKIGGKRHAFLSCSCVQSLFLYKTKLCTDQSSLSLDHLCLVPKRSILLRHKINVNLN